MRIYLATWLEDSQGTNLSEVGHKHRLLSYFFISQSKYRFSGQRKLKFDIRTYVKTGMAKLPKLKENERRGDED
jgi:hypothetical protein